MKWYIELRYIFKTKNLQALRGLQVETDLSILKSNTD